MSKSLFASDTNDIISSIQSELDEAQKSFNVKFGDDKIKNIKNIKDIEILYKLENKQNSQNAIHEYEFKINLSKEQVKQKQKLKSSVDKNDYAIYCEYIELKKNVDRIQQTLKNNNDYIDNSINLINNILQINGYIDSTNKLTLKGIIASQINDCNQIILTEMIVNDIFLNMTSEEIVAMLSIFVEPEKTDDDLLIKKYNEVCYTSRILSQRFFKVEEIIKSNIELEESMNYHNQNVWEITYNFADIAYSWAKNESLSDTMKYIGDMYIGQFCKNMIKISNIATDMIHLCEIAGKNEIIPHLSKIDEKIIRDFVNVNSLYLSN